MSLGISVAALGFLARFRSAFSFCGCSLPAPGDGHGKGLAALFGQASSKTGSGQPGSLHHRCHFWKPCF